MMYTPLDYIGDKLPYLTYLNAIIAYNFIHYTSNSFSFYKLPSGLPHHREQRIKVEVIYIFDGLDDKYISIFRKPYISFKPKIDCIPPELNIIVIWYLLKIMILLLLLEVLGKIKEFLMI